MHHQWKPYPHLYSAVMKQTKLWVCTGVFGVFCHLESPDTKPRPILCKFVRGGGGGGIVLKMNFKGFFFLKLLIFYGF